MVAQRKPAPAGVVMDHLLLGTADLDRGIAWIEKLTGVRAASGGSHPGAGTRNALLSLGGRRYLEIIAPDPAQPASNLTRNARVLTLVEPRTIGWAAAAVDIDALAADLRGTGVEVTGPRDGSRARTDGKLLQWRVLSVPSGFDDGAIDPLPFFIQWAAGSMHPSQDLPRGCELAGFEFAHSDPESLRKTLLKIGVDANVGKSGTSRLAATLDTPNGRVVIT